MSSLTDPSNPIWNTIGPGDTKLVGRILLGASGIFNLVGAIILIAGACLGQYIYTPMPGYDMYILLNHVRTDAFGTVTNSDLPDCMKKPLPAAMAMAIIGGCIGILVGLPLLVLTAKFQRTVLRFVRPVALLVGAVFGVIALIVALTCCKDDAAIQALLKKAKPYKGFVMLLIGIIFLFIAAVLAGVQVFFFGPKKSGEGEEANLEDKTATNYAPQSPGTPADGWTGTNANNDDVIERM